MLCVLCAYTAFYGMAMLADVFLMELKRLTIGYEMRRCSDGAVVFEGQSEHVFVGREGRLVRMRRDMPGFCDALEALIPRMSDA